MGDMSTMDRMAQKQKRFPNVPQNLQAKMESCVLDVKRKSGVSKKRAIAICFSSVVDGKDLDEMVAKELEQMNADEKRKIRRKQKRRLKRALAKQAEGIELTHEDMMLIAKSTEADAKKLVSKDQAAAEIAAAIAGTSEAPIEINEDAGDLMAFERSKKSLEKAGHLDDDDEDEEDEKKPEKSMHVDEVSSAHMDLPAGGSTTFDELDEYRDAMDEARDLRSVMFDFEMLVDNVMAKSDPGELGDKIVALGAEMKGRLESPPGPQRDRNHRTNQGQAHTNPSQRPARQKEIIRH